MKPAASALGRLSFAPPVEPKRVKAKPEPRPKAKNDPKLIAAARELRDRWLERVNATPLLSHGKYEVSRALPERSAPTATLGVNHTVRILPSPLAA